MDIRSLGEVVFDSGPREIADVAVVIPLFNHGNYILDCLRSVVDQTLERVSVIVIDDCSADSGARLAANFLGTHAARFYSVRVVRHKKNQGLSRARNSGIAWSGEPLLFMLDADNRIRPPALERLKSALDVDGADFAYSQLYMFGGETGVGVGDIWHVDRLRHGNTIDAMALIRRAALEEAGGYAVLANDYGWEDFDLWCRFFSLGKRGVFLPELLSEYRRDNKSMHITSTDRYHDTLMSEMSLRYPAIFNQ